MCFSVLNSYHKTLSVLLQSAYFRVLNRNIIDTVLHVISILYVRRERAHQLCLHPFICALQHVWRKCKCSASASKVKTDERSPRVLPTDWDAWIWLKRKCFFLPVLPNMLLFWWVTVAACEGLRISSYLSVRPEHWLLKWDALKVSMEN